MKELNQMFIVRLIAVVLFFNLFLIHQVYSQCQPLDPPAPTYNCEDVVVGVPPGKSGFYMNTPTNLEVVFDSYSDYAGSVVLSGATQLAITAEQLAASLPAQCKWELQMVVDNSTFGAPVAPLAAPAADEWFPDALYGLGSSGPYPQIYELEVRVNNACGTPISTVYQNFVNDFDAITVIDGTVLVAAASCGPGVNGAGSYLTNYGEYTFNIDYKIRLDASTLFGGSSNPFAYNPGRYKLNIHFCLREIP